MAGKHTLAETEKQVADRLSHMALDFQAMAVTSNLFRAASAMRSRFERTVLAEVGLSWTAFVVLWVTWIWDSAETREIAAESNISKATLTGVLSTLEKMGLVQRSRSQTDGRLVDVRVLQKGRDLMEDLFPRFNQQETLVSTPLSGDEKLEIAQMLRRITEGIES